MRQQRPRALWVGIGIIMICSCISASLMLAGSFASREANEERLASSAYAREVAQKITDYELPEGYQEQVGLEFLETRLAMIAPDPSGLNMAFVMMQFADSYNVTESFMLEQLQLNWRDQSGQDSSGFDLISRDPITLRAQETIITTYEGEDERGREMRQQVAIFEGKTGPAILMISGPVEDWDEESVDLFLNSLR